MDPTGGTVIPMEIHIIERAGEWSRALERLCNPGVTDEDRILRFELLVKPDAGKILAQDLVRCVQTVETGHPDVNRRRKNGLSIFDHGLIDEIRRDLIVGERIDQ